MKYFEVFKAGNYPQGAFSKEEVQELANNYDPSFCEAPITLDHEQKGPAYGWVDRLKEENGVLKASFKNLSDDLKEFVSCVKNALKVLKRILTKPKFRNTLNLIWQKF